jgi:hypothetical protein
LLLPLLASAYGFSQSDAKTEDHFFLGFPSYWNVVAIYLYWLKLPAWLALALIILLALLTFVPSLYLYTSYKGPFSRLTNWLLLGWMVLLVLIVAQIFADPQQLKLLVWLSLAFPIYYFVLSWLITLQRCEPACLCWLTVARSGDYTFPPTVDQPFGTNHYAIFKAVYALAVLHLIARNFSFRRRAEERQSQSASAGNGASHAL